MINVRVVRDTINEKQELLIQEVLKGSSIGELHLKIGVGKDTVRKWLSYCYLQEEIKKRRAELDKK